MRLLKELDRQAFKERFTNKQACYEFLAELKWQTDINAHVVTQISI